MSSAVRRIPYGADAPVRKRQDLERSQKEQAAARSLAASQIGNGGTLQVDGSLVVTGSLSVPAGALSSSANMTAGVDVIAGRDVTAGRNMVATGSLNGASVAVVGTANAANGVFSSGLSSVGAYNTDVSLLSGARQTVWQHNSGVYGFAPSSIKTKTNLKPVPFSAADVLAVTPYVFQYRGQVAIRDDPDNDEYDPDYVVPWEIGLMAEHLIEHNMACFVFWDPDGVTPRGINYDLFGAIAPLVVLADQERRLRAAGL